MRKRMGKGVGSRFCGVKNSWHLDSQLILQAVRFYINYVNVLHCAYAYCTYAYRKLHMFPLQILFCILHMVY